MRTSGNINMGLKYFYVIQFQAKSMKIIFKIYDVKPVEHLGATKGSILKAKLMSL
jgi:hypothetical protein